MHQSTDKFIEEAFSQEVTELNLRERILDTHHTSILSKMQQLKKIDLSESTLDDVSFLGQLRNLRYLNLSNVSVRQLDPVETLDFASNLNLLDTLVCDHAHVRSLHPLRDCKVLRTLSLRHTHVSDLSPLEDLNNLRNLCLDHSLVIDFSPILENSGLFWDPGEFGLTFSFSLLARMDPEVSKISKLSDNYERSINMLRYLKSNDAGPSSGIELALSEMLLELPQQADAAIQAAMSGSGDKIVEIVDTKFSNSSQDEITKQGWVALKEHYEEIQHIFEKDNFPTLRRALRSFGKALGTEFEKVQPISLGTHGTRVVEISRNSRNLLLEDEYSELLAFAGTVANLIVRFPEWRTFKGQTFSETDFDSAIEISESRGQLVQLSKNFEKTNILSAELFEKLNDLLILLPEEESDTSKVITVSVFRSISNILKSVIRGAIGVILQTGQKTKEVAIKTVANALVAGGAAASGVFLDFLLFNGSVLSKLAQSFPKTFGWVEKVIQTIF